MKIMVTLYSYKAAITLTVIILASIFAPFVTRHNPMAIVNEMTLQPPSTEHWLGTDHLGRDIFSRVVFGGRQTLTSALIATFITVIFALPLGLLYGLNIRSLDGGLAVLLNTFLSIPSLLIAMVVLTVIGGSSLSAAMAVGIAQVGSYGHVTRAAVLATRSQDYVEAAISCGAGRWHIIRRHIWPNIMPTVLTYTAIVFSYSLINVASLSFLGLGTNPAVPDWGRMLADGRMGLRIAPWVVLFPGIAIAITIASVQSLVDRYNQSS